MAHAPYIFTARAIGQDRYHVMVDRNGYIDSPRAGRDVDMSVVSKLLFEVASEASMKGREIIAHGVTAADFGDHGYKPFRSLTFAA